MCTFGIVYPEIKILSLFTHPLVVPNLYDLLSSALRKGSALTSMIIYKEWIHLNKKKTFSANCPFSAWTLLRRILTIGICTIKFFYFIFFLLIIGLCTIVFVHLEKKINKTHTSLSNQWIHTPSLDVCPHFRFTPSCFYLVFPVASALRIWLWALITTARWMRQKWSQR